MDPVPFQLALDAVIVPTLRVPPLSLNAGHSGPCARLSELQPKSPKPMTTRPQQEVPESATQERVKLIVISGRIHAVTMRRRYGSWIMQAPRLATPEQIATVAKDEGYPADFYEALHASERLFIEEQRHRARGEPPTPLVGSSNMKNTQAGRVANKQ